MKKIVFHSDPGHAWVEAPVSELVKYGIADKISVYSYRKGLMAYLEEDCDAGVYIKALEASGVNFEFVEKYEEYTPIRNYPSYY